MLSDGGGAHVDAVDDDHADAAALMNMNTNDDHARRLTMVSRVSLVGCKYAYDQYWSSSWSSP